MSLINKMLSDLEKRQAYLREDQDKILEGLYSAYDLEPGQSVSPKKLTKVFFAIVFVMGLSIWCYSFFIHSDNQVFSASIVDGRTEVEAEKEQATLVKISQAEYTQKQQGLSYLQLEDELELGISANEQGIFETNRVESIQFEPNSNGLDLIIEMPQEIDYLVYGLKDPSRTVIEIENAKMDIPIEKLNPADPIVAIRYFVHEDNRLKLVLESVRDLAIEKVSTLQQKDKYKLIISTQYDLGVEVNISMDSSGQDDSLALNTVDSEENFEQQLLSSNETVFKGELVKTPVEQNASSYAEKLFMQAMAHYKRKDISRSLKLLNLALDHNPAHVNARSTLSMILSEQGHNDLAHSVLNEGLIAEPNQVDWLKMSARLLLQEGKMVEAAEQLAKHHPPLSSNTDFYAMKAAILQKLNNHQQAARIYRDLLQVNPSKAIWWMGLGISLEGLKRYNDALYAYQKALNSPALASESKIFVTKRLNNLAQLINVESS